MKYYLRGEDGKETGKAIHPDDIVDVNKYVIVITALEGSGYEGGVVRVPFDIRARDISGIKVAGRDQLRLRRRAEGCHLLHRQGR